MRSSRGIGYDRADDTFDDWLASKQSFWHRRDRRVRVLDGKIVVREATLAVIGGTLLALVFLLCATDVVVVMMLGVVVSVRRPRALGVMARVVWQSVVVMRPWPMMVFAERPVKRHVDCRQNLDAAEPNEARDHGDPPHGRSGPTQASCTHALRSRHWKTSHRLGSVSGRVAFINRSTPTASKRIKETWVGKAAHSLYPGRRRRPSRAQGAGRRRLRTGGAPDGWNGEAGPDVLFDDYACFGRGVAKLLIRDFKV